jgi:hypothetical protein
MLARMHNCQWDEIMRTLTTAEEATREEEVKAFKSASWFKDDFGLLPKALGKQKKYTAPEALYNLEGAGSIKTIHDCHEKQNKPKANAATSAEKKKQKKDDAIKVLSSSKSSGKLGSSSTSRDSTSQPSSYSEESSLSNRRLRSKGNQDGMAALGAAQGG